MSTVANSVWLSSHGKSIFTKSSDSLPFAPSSSLRVCAEVVVRTERHSVMSRKALERTSILRCVSGGFCLQVPLVSFGPWLSNPVPSSQSLSLSCGVLNGKGVRPRAASTQVTTLKKKKNNNDNKNERNLLRKLNGEHHCATAGERVCSVSTRRFGTSRVTSARKAQGLPEERTCTMYRSWQSVGSARESVNRQDCGSVKHRTQVSKLPTDRIRSAIVCRLDSALVGS